VTHEDYFDVENDGKAFALIALLAPYVSRSCDFGPLTN